MRTFLLTLPFALALATATAAPAHAQNSTRNSTQNPAVLPVWNNASGQLEAYLVLEPAQAANARWRASGGQSLDAAFRLRNGDQLALLCDRKSGIATSISNLANNCLLASLDAGGSQRTEGTAAISRGRNTIGVNFGNSQSSLPAWLTPGLAARTDQNDLTVFAQRNIGSQGFVTIAGTVAHARLLSPAVAQASGLASDQWSSRNLTVGGGFGNFGASIVGHVVDTPGQPRWEGLGLGLTWRTPWSGRLSVGADNIVTRGRNPFNVSNGQQDEGATPYIRYEQGL